MLQHYFMLYIEHFLKHAVFGFLLDCQISHPDKYKVFPLKSLLNWGPNSCDAGIQQLHNQQEHLFCDSNLVDAESSLCHTNSRRSSRSKQLHVGDLEMLLEAYFIQIDGTLNKLSTVCHSSCFSSHRLLFECLSYGPMPCLIT